VSAFKVNVLVLVFVEVGVSSVGVVVIVFFVFVEVVLFVVFSRFKLKLFPPSLFFFKDPILLFPSVELEGWGFPQFERNRSSKRIFPWTVSLLEV